MATTSRSDMKITFLGDNDVVDHIINVAGTDHAPNGMIVASITD